MQRPGLQGLTLTGLWVSINSGLSPIRRASIPPPVRENNKTNHLCRAVLGISLKVVSYRYLLPDECVNIKALHSTMRCD